MEEEAFELILQSKIFKIPSKFPSLIYVDRNIYTKLITEKRYEVKTRSNELIFQSFVNYWVNEEIPDLQFDNIDEYDELSQEFDIMKEIILIFQKSTSNVEIKILMKKKEEFKQKILEKRNKLATAKKKFNEVIQILFRSDTISNLRNDKIDFKKLIIGDPYLIDLNVRKKVTINGIIFALNEKEKTAGVFKCTSQEADVFIPHSINYGFTEFVVTTIHQNSFSKSKEIKTIKFPENSQINLIEKSSFAFSSIESIKFPNNVTKIAESAFSTCKNLVSVEFSEKSELKIIENNAFESSSIKKIKIPSSVELKEGWCSRISELNDITIISNSNENKIIYYDDKFIIGKSDIKSSNYDILYFVRQDLEKVIIPSFIKIIAPYAFNSSKLNAVEFPEDSQIKIIDNCAFFASKIADISIPSSVTQIGDSCFSSCKDLKSITFSENSKLKYLGKFAFLFSTIEEIKIPPQVTKIQNSTFTLCDKLLKVEFSNNSTLRAIGKYSFISSGVKSITIPSSIIYFKEEWCTQTCNIYDINIFTSNKVNIICYDNKLILGKSNPKSDVFDILFFARRDIENILIPPFIKQIASYAFERCNKLKFIEFTEDSQLQLIEKYAFLSTSIEKIIIPSNVIRIDKFAFAQCSNLKEINFSQESKLKEIGSFAFSITSIESICIPSSLIKINEKCFFQCKRLKSVEFSQKSQLKTIENRAFSYSSIENLSIPSSITKLQQGWCASLDNLKNINIFSNNCNEDNIMNYQNNELMIGKSDLKGSNYDVLYFAKKILKK